VIEYNNMKKIVVIANRAIARGEEITYNYFFASEQERISCACGAINCAGRLN
jgi:SET domain-containing protein